MVPAEGYWTVSDFERNSDEALPSDSESKLHVETAAKVGDNNNVTRSQDKIWLRSKHPWNADGILPFTDGHSKLKMQVALHVNKDYTSHYFSILHISEPTVVSRD
jgi:hypothetical protein